MINYDDKYYLSSSVGAVKSAKEIVPYIIKIIKPQSVIDVGCGIGSFLSVFKQYEVENHLGLDSLDLNKDLLLIDKNKFIGVNFEKLEEIHLTKKYDLCLCLEVAEHLSKGVADSFIDFLVSLSDITVFSAAIPNQGGINHINEQWPSYWVQKFSVRNYVLFDILRPYFWNNENIEFWYRQNILIFLKIDRFDIENKLKEFNQTKLLDVVHPLQLISTIFRRE